MYVNEYIYILDIVIKIIKFNLYKKYIVNSFIYFISLLRLYLIIFMK